MFIVCRCFDDGHYEQREVICHCSFDLHFSNLEKANIFSFVCWPSVCLLWRNVCLDLLLIFWLDCLFAFYNKLHKLFVYFGDLIPYQLLHLQIFFPILRTVILFVVSVFV